MLNDNLEQWPHLNELVDCYKAVWVKDDLKYGHYEAIPPLSFQSQVFEGPDTDIETELQLSSARHSRTEDVSDDDIPSTSGRVSFTSRGKILNVHLGESPLPAYEPAFDWENERSMIFGQRISEPYPTQCCSRLKISVKILSLSFQAGLIEPFYGTICLYNKERKERLSEDFYFRALPTEENDVNLSLNRKGIFSLDTPSVSICLLIQLEKPVTEDGGVSQSVYSRKEPVHLTDREKQRLQIWSRIMPYREPFAWTILPLFENNVSTTGVGSPSSPLAPSLSGFASQDSGLEPSARNGFDGKQTQYTCGDSVIVEISNLNKVKENYTEESLEDPKRKVHKSIKGVLRLEVERLHPTDTSNDSISENGSGNGPVESRVHFAETKNQNISFNGLLTNNSRCSLVNGKAASRNVPASGSHSFLSSDDFHAFDFREMTRSEPYSQLLHCLYLYPLSVNLCQIGRAHV